MKINIKGFEIDMNTKTFISFNTGEKGRIGTINNLSAYVFLSIGKIIRIKKPYCVLIPKGDKRGSKNSIGYPVHRLTNDDGERLYCGNCRENRLLWRAFKGEIPLDENGRPMEIDHHDRNPWNNNISNLKLMSHKHNVDEHVRLRALEYVKENNIPVPTNKAKPKSYQQVGLF